MNIRAEGGKDSYHWGEKLGVKKDGPKEWKRLEAMTEENPIVNRKNRRPRYNPGSLLQSRTLRKEVITYMCYLIVILILKRGFIKITNELYPRVSILNPPFFYRSLF